MDYEMEDIRCAECGFEYEGEVENPNTLCECPECIKRENVMEKVKKELDATNWCGTLEDDAVVDSLHPRLVEYVYSLAGQQELDLTDEGSANEIVFNELFNYAHQSFCEYLLGTSDIILYGTLVPLLARNLKFSEIIAVMIEKGFTQKVTEEGIETITNKAGRWRQ